jgi:putative salt-induced outer membrane protein
MTSNASKLSLMALACVISCSVSTAALAQAKADGQWRGNGGAALSLTSGNTSSSSLLLNADAEKATAADKISLGAAINYATNKSGGKNQTTSNRWASFGQYDFNLSPQLFAFGRLGLEGDKLSDLSLRTALAGGLGYKVINTEALTFDLFGGVGYTTDSYGSRRTIGSKSGTSFSRASLYFGEASSHKLSSTVSFKQRLELYPGVSGDKAMLAKFNAGLGVAMSSTLNLTVGLTDSYNSKPPAGFKKNDIGLFTGVNVKFGAQ